MPSSEMPERIWLAEFRGPHIDGVAYLALPEKQAGYESSYIRADVAKAQRDDLLAALKLASRDLSASGERERGPTIRAVIAKAERGES